MRINFDLDDLEAFLAVMDLGSFHGASQRLNLSQPAVSRRIQKLEHALGSNLFERTTRSVVPTLAAKRLQARAEALMDDASDIERTMRDESVAFAHQRQAIVTIASVPSVLSRVIPGALKLLSETGEVPRIRFLDTSANETTTLVSSGEADFGLCSLNVSEPNVDFETLFQDRIVLALGSDHPLTAEPTVHLEHLVDEPLILPARGTGNRLLIDETLAQSNLPLRWTFEVNRTSTALDLVAEGVGLAFLPESALRGAGPKKVVWRPVQNLVIHRPIGIVTRRGKIQNQSVTALRQSIMRVGKGVAEETDPI